MSSTTPGETQLRRSIVGHLKAARWQEAAVLLQRWCQDRPRDAAARLNLAYCLSRLQRLPEALSEAERAADLDPDLQKAVILRDQLRRHLRPAVIDAESSTPEGEADGSEETAEDAARTLPREPVEGVWAEGSVVAGRYEIRYTARGGMGLVAIAFDRELQRMVAIKTPLPSIMASEDGRARFLREAEAWIALGVHPNVCTAYYVQELDGLPRLVIEHVGGGDLDRWLSKKRRLTLEQRLDIAIQVAEGMAYTHDFQWTDEAGREHRGVLHRDLKPANVLMTSDGVARLTDFGLVRARSLVDEEPVSASLMAARRPPPEPDPTPDDTGGSMSWRTVTEAGGVVGTPPYLAPEMWKASARATVASDVYAYGCVLYELFCGRRPYLVTGKAEGPQRNTVLMGWLKAHTTVPPPDPTLLEADLDPRLGALLQSCIAKEPAARPPSFRAIADRLEEIYARLVGQAYTRTVPERTLLVADSLNNRAVSFVTLGQPARAERAWRQALEVQPGHREASFNLAVWNWLRGRSADAELLRHVAESVRQRGVDVRDLQLAARLRLWSGEQAAAVETLRRARSVSGEDAAVDRDLGLALAALASTGNNDGARREAISRLEPLAEDAGCEPEVLIGLSGCASRHPEDGDAGRAAWGRLRQRDPDLPDDPSTAAARRLPGWEERHVVRQPGKVLGLAVMGSGHVVCRCEGGVLSVWRPGDDRGHGRGKVPPQATRGVSMVALPGGPRLAVASQGQPVVVVDLDEGRVVRRLRAHPGYVTALAAGPDGSLVLSGGSDRRLRVWEVETGDCRTTMEGHQAYVGAVAFLPTGGYALSGGGDGTVRLWDIVAGRCLHAMSGHAGAVDCVAVLGNGRLAASGGEDGIVRVWDLSSGEVLHTLVGHAGTVLHMRNLPDGRHLVTAGADQTLRCWDAATGRVLQVWRLHHPVAGLELHPDGPWAVVASGHQADTIRVVTQLERRPPLELTRPLTARELAARDQRFRTLLARARELIDAGEMEAAVPVVSEARGEPGFERHREALSLWRKVTSHLPKESLREAFELQGFSVPAGAVAGCALASAERLAVSGSADGGVRVWDLVSGRVMDGSDGDEDAVVAVAPLPPDGAAVAVGRRSGSVSVVPLEDPGRPVELGRHDGVVVAVRAAPEGGHVLSAGEDGTVRAWPVTAGADAEVVATAPESLACLAVSADGRLVATGGWDRRVTVWSREHRAPVQRFEGHQGVVRAVDISPNLRQLASGSEDGTVRLWDLETGRCQRVLAGHDGGVTEVSFTPDARFVISAGRDGTVRVWSLRTAACLESFEAATGPVLAVAVSDDGGSILSGGADGSVRQWFLDWVAEPVEPSGWDDRVRPFLDVRWRMRQGDAGGPVSDGLVADVLADLGRRGYGWVSPHRVRTELERLTTGWESRRSREKEVLDRRAQRQARRQRAEPVREVVANVTKNLGLKLAGGVVLVIAAILGLLSLRSPGEGDVRLNDSLRVDLQEAVRGVIEDLHTPGRARAFQGETAQVIANPASFCQSEELAGYLDLALHPARHTTPAPDPTVPSMDPVFRQRYLEAVVCLYQLGDADLAWRVLRRAGAGVHPLHQLDLLRVLVGVGPGASGILVEAMDSGEREVRRSAALALLYMDREESVQLLVHALHEGDPGQTEAASFVLRELIATNRIPAEEALQLILLLAQSIEPQVRANAVLALEMFEPTKPVLEILDDADEDPASSVRRAAASTRLALREAARIRYMERPGAPGG